MMSGLNARGMALGPIFRAGSTVDSWGILIGGRMLSVVEQIRMLGWIQIVSV